MKSLIALALLLLLFACKKIETPVPDQSRTTTEFTTSNRGLDNFELSSMAAGPGDAVVSSTRPGGQTATGSSSGPTQVSGSSSPQSTPVNDGTAGAPPIGSSGGTNQANPSTSPAQGIGN